MVSMQGVQVRSLVGELKIPHATQKKIKDHHRSLIFLSYLITSLLAVAFMLFQTYVPRTGLGDFTFTFHFHALEKEMATHSSVLAWRIPGTGEPGGLLSLGSHRVGHD